MITVIIPVLNESATIAEVIAFARQEPLVTEVLVVDDGSIDGTAERAAAAGATVITSTLLGKGASMEDGMEAATNEVLLYLDGDLSGLRGDLIRSMTQPIRADEADFVKARFSRAGGRVTTLTARPLLRVFYPELAHLEQPLSGIIAARRSLLRRLRFENDYGVDIGLLIDAAAYGARIAEVDIGHIEHESQPLANLGAMANQVVRALLHRAARNGRMRLTQLQEVEEVERQALAAGPISVPRSSAKKLALFDMDGTLLSGRYIVELARRTNRSVELMRYLDNDVLLPEQRTWAISSLFRDVPAQVFEDTARTIPLSLGAVETVVNLRKAGYRVGVISDGYWIAAEIVRRRVFADFCIAHVLKFRRGRATGEVTLAPMMTHPNGCPEHVHCKVNAMRHLCEQMRIDAEQVLAVGDGDNDVCLLQAAGTSIAYQPKSLLVRAAADLEVYGDLTEVIASLNRAPDEIPA